MRKPTDFFSISVYVFRNFFRKICPQILITYSRAYFAFPTIAKDLLVSWLVDFNLQK